MKTSVITTRGVGCLLGASLLLGLAAVAPALEPEVRRLPVKVYRDRMKGGWIGQIAGV